MLRKMTIFSLMFLFFICTFADVKDFKKFDAPEKQSSESADSSADSNDYAKGYTAGREYYEKRIASGGCISTTMAKLFRPELPGMTDRSMEFRKGFEDGVFSRNTFGFFEMMIGYLVIYYVGIPLLLIFLITLIF